MKGTSWLAFLLAAVVCVDTAHSIMCFTCEHQTSNWKCLRLINCPDSAQKCLTIGSLSRTGNNTKLLITKMCALDCPTIHNVRHQASNSVYCCDHSWCNIGPPQH